MELRMETLEHGQNRLEQSQRKLQRDDTDLKQQVGAIWEDIRRLDHRLGIQEKRTAQ